ncbi:MAG: hypothetical protein ACI4AI_07205 [Paludibacteraceae bacterium]
MHIALREWYCNAGGIQRIINNFFGTVNITVPLCNQHILADYLTQPPT